MKKSLMLISGIILIVTIFTYSGLFAIGSNGEYISVPGKLDLSHNNYNCICMNATNDCTCVIPRKWIIPDAD